MGFVGSVLKNKIITPIVDGVVEGAADRNELVWAQARDIADLQDLVDDLNHRLLGVKERVGVGVKELGVLKEELKYAERSTQAWEDTAERLRSSANVEGWSSSVVYDWFDATMIQSRATELYNMSMFRLKREAKKAGVPLEDIREAGSVFNLIDLVMDWE